MAEYFPGSVIEKNELTGREFLRGMFIGSKGMVMSQIRDLTGLNTSAVQNWINRKWLSHPQGKKYNIDQVARILIINMMRNTMSLENIAALLFYLNGVAGDVSDDTICESELYGYICDMLFFEASFNASPSELIESVTTGFSERREGDFDKLKNTLKVIYYNAMANKYASAAEKLLTAIK